MKNLIAAECYKLFHGKVFTIVAVGNTLQTLLIIALYYTANRPIGQGQAGISMIVNTSLFTQIWILGFIGYFVSSEFQNGTMRNILALGKNRIYVYLSKLFSVGIALTAMLLITSVTATIALTVLYGFGNIPLHAFLSMFVITFFMQLLYHFAHASIFLMLAFLSRSLGLTLMFGIGYWIVNANVPAILRALNFIATIAYFPDFYISRFAALNGDSTFIINGIIVSMVYILVASILGSITFNKSDIK